MNETNALMKKFNKMTDEELAVYMEQVMLKKKSVTFDKSMDVDSLEVLSVSRKAVTKFADIDLPEWKNHFTKGSIDVGNGIFTANNLPMAGFMGDVACCERLFDDDDTDPDFGPDENPF